MLHDDGIKAAPAHGTLLIFHSQSCGEQPQFLQQSEIDKTLFYGIGLINYITFVVRKLLENCHVNESFFSGSPSEKLLLLPTLTNTDTKPTSYYRNQYNL